MMRAFSVFLAGLVLFVAFGVFYLTALDPSRDVTILQNTTSACVADPARGAWRGRLSVGSDALIRPFRGDARLYSG